VIVAHSKESLQEKIKIASNFFHSMSLKANILKTHVVLFTPGGRIPKAKNSSLNGEKSGLHLSNNTSIWVFFSHHPVSLEANKERGIEVWK
jgi:hypothetical protein